MAEVHGSDTVTLLNGTDISQYCTNTDDDDTTEEHDTTTYGRKRRRYAGGLGDGTFTQAGFYDTALGSVEDIVKPLKAARTIVPFVKRPEGTGAGLPQTTVNVLITNFKQSHPVDDMVKWEMTLRKSGDITESTQ